MANICCDDVYFYSELHPEYLTALWEDLETSIIFCRNEDLAWIGNLFRLKNISTDGISLRGTVIYMERNDDNILLGTSQHGPRFMMRTMRLPKPIRWILPCKA